MKEFYTLIWTFTIKKQKIEGIVQKSELRNVKQILL